MTRWSLAAELPDQFAPRWREPGQWSRLAEEGSPYVMLPGLLTEEAALAIRAAVLELPMARMTTVLLDADRHLLADDEVVAWLDLLQGEALRALVGDVLHREMPLGLVVNAWRLNRGDHMGVHPDGPLYRGTVSLGLCTTWTPADGGAIAFGDKAGDDFVVRERWYPHLGDACMFAPAADTWHCVEPVQTDVERHSLTGWWTEPADGLTRGRDG
ncbi:MAG: 2OG-Fe(II) oxygenase [Polyangiales bacterium]